MPIWPFTAYFCYKQPGRIKDTLYKHYPRFESFVDFEYAFMQNVLGNILTYMDIYEEMIHSVSKNNYVKVFELLGRGVRRTFIFDSMLKSTGP